MSVKEWQAILCKSQVNWILCQFVTLQHWVTVTSVCAMPQQDEVYTTDLGVVMMGCRLNGTSRVEHWYDWSPCTWSGPAEPVESTCYTPPRCSASSIQLECSASNDVLIFNLTFKHINPRSHYNRLHTCNLIKFWIKVKSVSVFCVCERLQCRWQHCLLLGERGKNSPKLDIMQDFITSTLRSSTVYFKCTHRVL